MKKPLFPLVLVMLLVVLPIGIYSLSDPLTNTKEIASPSDRIKAEDIHVSKKQVTINIDNAILAEFEDTNSMDPVIDSEATAIEITPTSEKDLKVGDIIAYESEYGTIIHRIEKISDDEEGWYVLAKGDNNKDSDPFKIRFNQIKYVLVGILY